MNGQLAGKTIAILVAHEFEDIELLYPILRLSEEGAAVLVAPCQMGFHTRPYLEGKAVTGRFGHPVPVPVMPPGQRYQICTLKELVERENDCLLFPGGFSPDYLRREGDVLELMRCHYGRGGLVAAICHAPWILISAGIMQGKRATGVRAVRDDLLNAGAIFLDEAVVFDSGIITSRTPNDLPDFCREIIQQLLKR